MPRGDEVKNFLHLLFKKLHKKLIILLLEKEINFASLESYLDLAKNINDKVFLGFDSVDFNKPSDPTRRYLRPYDKEEIRRGKDGKNY